MVKLRTEVIRETAASKVILSDHDFVIYEILCELSEAIQELSRVMRK